MKDISFEENIESNVLLCKKCYQKGEYINALYSLNKENDTIEYKCSRCHILKEDDVLGIKIDEKIKNSLSKCRKEHEENAFCGWCNECQKNICFLCIPEENKKKHKYILFMELFPEQRMENIFDKQVKKLKSLFKEYNSSSPYFHSEINHLIQLFICCVPSFNLFYKENIINYQTINNVNMNLNDLSNDINLLETKFNEYNYLEFFSNILIRENKDKVNQINKIDQKIITINEIKEPIKILTLINDNDGENHKKYFVIFYSVQKKLSIFNVDLILVNEIDLDKFLENEITEIIEYDSKTLLLFNSMKFIFIKLSSDYKQYNITYYYSKTIPDVRECFNLFLKFPEKIKLIKYDENNICLLRKNKLYINLREIIFKNESNHEYDAKLLSNNALNKGEEYILDIIPMYYNDNDNAKIKRIISFGILFNLNNITNIDFFENFIFDFEYKIDIYTNEFKIKDSFKLKNIMKLSCNYFINLNYNCLNNMLLVFIKDYIFQININTREITTIYAIDSPTLLFETKKKDLYSDKICEEKIQIYSIHNYNNKLKKMEKIILLKEIKTNIIYPYIWEDNSLLFKKEFKLPKFLCITEFDIFDNNKKIPINSANESPYKIIIDSNKIVLFK